MAKVIDIEVSGSYKGANAIKKAAADVDELDAGAQKTKQSFGDMAKNLGLAAGVAGAAMASLAVAGAAAYDALKEGAVLADTKDDFDDLAASIGTTADALESRLGGATAGLVSNTQLIADATTMMSTNLGLSEERIIAFAGAAAELDWDLNTLTDTLNTKMTRGLKELGVNIDETKARIAELEEAGYSADDAFQMALLEAAATKIEMVGKKSEETAGKIQILENVWTNTTDAFKEEFARAMADQMGIVSDSAVEAGENMEMAAEGAARLAAAMTQPFTDLFIGSGVLLQIKDYRQEVEELAVSMEDVSKARQLWLESTKPGHTLEDNMAILEEMAELVARLNDEYARANPELKYIDGWVDTRDAIEEAVVAVERFDKAAQRITIDAKRLPLQELADLAFAWEKSEDAVSGYEDSVMGLAELAADGIEAHREAADESAAYYEASARSMSGAFSAALEEGAMPDFGNMDAMRESAFAMAEAFGITVPVLADIGVQMGIIDSQTAEAAGKAALFQGAMGVLLNQLASGAIDPTQFTTAVDQMVSDLENNTVVDLQVNLVAKQEAIQSIRDMDWLPQAAQDAMIVNANLEITVSDQALKDAIGMIDGIPDNDEKIITFTPEDQAVLDSVLAIDTAITGIPGVVLFKPEATDVYNTISDIDGRVVTVYVNYVNTGAPSPSGGGGGGPTPAPRSAPTSKSNDTADFPDFYAQIRQEGVAW